MLNEMALTLLYKGYYFEFKCTQTHFYIYNDNNICVVVFKSYQYLIRVIHLNAKFDVSPGANILGPSLLFPVDVSL